MIVALHFLTVESRMIILIFGFPREDIHIFRGTPTIRGSRSVFLHLPILTKTILRKYAYLPICTINSVSMTGKKTRVEHVYACICGL